MQLLRSFRRWLWQVKLGLIQREITDTLDDMSYELAHNNLGNWHALADFHTELVIEANVLRAKLGLHQFLTT